MFAHSARQTGGCFPSASDCAVWRRLSLALPGGFDSLARKRAVASKYYLATSVEKPANKLKTWAHRFRHHLVDTVEVEKHVEKRNEVS